MGVNNLTYIRSMTIISIFGMLLIPHFVFPFIQYDAFSEHTLDSDREKQEKLWGGIDGKLGNLTFLDSNRSKYWSYEIYAASWNPNGTLLAHGGLDVFLYIHSFENNILSLNFSEFCMMGVEVTAWSPDGRYLAVGGRGAAIDGAPRLIIYEFNGTDWTRVSHGRTMMYELVKDISWSPDGKYIAVAGTGSEPGQYWNPESQVQVYSFDGSSLTSIDEFMPPGVVFSSVSWNPSGDVICLGGQCANQDIYLRGFNGSQLTTHNYGLRRRYIPITNCSSFDPTGEYIAAVGNYDGYEVEILRYNGMESYPTLITSADFGEGARYVTWMDDGTHLIVGGKNGTSDLVVYSFDGSTLEKLQYYDHGNHTNVIDICGRFVAVGGDKDPDDLRVYAFNNDPIANDDLNIPMEEDSEILIELLSNDMDPDGDDIIILNVTNVNHGSLNISTDNRTVTYIPEQDWFGVDTFNYTISDLYGGSSNASVTVTVKNINDPPEIVTDDVDIALEDSMYMVDYEAIDIDTGDALLWSLDTDTDFLSINSSNGILNGMPENDHVGIHLVNISVSDNEGGSDHSQFFLEVLNTNDGPVINSRTFANATEDELFYLDIDISDIDPDDSVSLHMISDARWLVLKEKPWSLSGTPSNSDVGKCFVNITAIDESDASGSLNFTISVSNVNDPPVITTKGIVNGKENESYFMSLSATDIDPTKDKMTWTFTTNASSWLYLDPNTGVLRGFPTFQDSGNYWINVSVNDGNGGFDWWNYTFSVLDNHTIVPKPSYQNQPPVLSVGDVNPREGNTSTEFVFRVHYDDLEQNLSAQIFVYIDGSSYRMALLNGEPWNGTYTLKMKLDEGNHSFFFNATDGSLFALSNDLTPVNKEEAHIIKVQETAVNEDNDDDPGEMTEEDKDIFRYIISGTIILLIIILILFFINRSKTQYEE